MLIIIGGAIYLLSFIVNQIVVGVFHVSSMDAYTFMNGQGYDDGYLAQFTSPFFYIRTVIPILMVIVGMVLAIRAKVKGEGLGLRPMRIVFAIYVGVCAIWSIVSLIVFLAQRPQLIIPDSIINIVLNSLSFAGLIVYALGSLRKYE